jgi:hypothetical protein
MSGSVLYTPPADSRFQTISTRSLSHEAPNTAYTTAQFGRDSVGASVGQTRFGVVITFDPHG